MTAGHRAGGARGRRPATLGAALALAMASALALAPVVPSTGLAADGLAVVTPLEASGLSPLWGEDVAGGSLQVMQFAWAKGDHGALTSHTQPGAVYLGQAGVLNGLFVEQELNHFQSFVGEPLPSTLEFDVLNPISGRGRVSLRPRRRGDMIHIQMGLKNDSTKVNVRFTNTALKLAYSERTGPSRGWTHITVSYRQFTSGGVVMAHYVIAVNEEVHEIQGASGIVNPDWLTNWSTDAGADGWSIEHRGEVDPMGKYLTGIRGYAEFLTASDMRARLAGRVAPHRAGLPDPRGFGGPTQAFQMDRPLALKGPNAIAYATPVDPSTAAPYTIRFDGSLSSGWEEITSYAWTFGDGASGAGRVVQHTYGSPGTYPATLTVVTVDGGDSRSLSVVVGG